MKGSYSLPADFRGILEECAVRSMDEDAQGVPEWERFRVASDEVGIFLYIVARSTARKRIVEMGGAGGAGSAIVWLAGAAIEVDGLVTAWETNPRRWVKLQNSLSQARLSPSVRLNSIDPLWPIEDEGGVIAPPMMEEPDDIGNGDILDGEIEPYDMAVVTLLERDWQHRLTRGWEILDTGGLLVVTDTANIEEAEQVWLEEFFGMRTAAVAGIQLAEGVVLARKLSDEVLDKPRSTVPSDDMVVGEPVNDVLKELESENRKPGSRLWAIPPVTGRLLWILVSAMNAREVLEIGASSGYSGTWIGCALAHTGGHLTTMDFDADKVKYARETYRRTGVDDRVNILLGDALDIVPTLNTQYDLVFLDCNKEYYHDLLEPILWRLRRGGLLIADNVISHQDTLKGYLDEVKEHSSLVSITLPIGSGEELTMVL